ncbi:MAG: GTP cyclohydrolase IIa [Acidilobaceae archaeon]
MSRASYWTRVVLVELYGYREWTESLGSRREWRVQEAQTEVYKVLQRESEKLGFFALPGRFDYEILLAPNADPEALPGLLEALKAVSPTPLRASSACGETPRDSERESFKLLSETPLSSVAFRECRRPEAIAIAHIDFNNITGYTRRTSPLESLVHFTEIYARIARLAFDWGGIAAYLGGDNVLVAMSPAVVDSLTSRLLEIADLKAGVGIAESAGEAVALATEALDDVRRHGLRERVVVKSSLREA